MACRRFWLWSIAAAISFCLLVSFVSTEGAADDRFNPTIGRKAVPLDYRHLIARAILKKTDRHKIRRAEITAPSLSYWSYGHPTPVVCARLTIQDTNGEKELSSGFTFDNGQIDEIFNPADAEPMVGAARAAVIKFGHKCGTQIYQSFPEIPTSTK